jgi:hypothetical protein
MASWTGEPYIDPGDDEYVDQRSGQHTYLSDTFWTNLAAFGVMVLALAIVVIVGVIAGNAS